MSNTPFQFPPPPPPPPRKEAHTEPAFPQPSYLYSQSGRDRGPTSGLWQNRGSPSRPYGHGRANYRGDTAHRGYGRGGTGNVGTHGSNYGSQQHHSFAPSTSYGEISDYASTRGQRYTSDWNEATRGGTTQSHGFHHNGPNGTHFPSLYRPPPQKMQPRNAYPSSPPSGGPQPPRKRPYSTAFNRSSNNGPRPQAPPAVPSFNASIPLSVQAQPLDPAPAKAEKPRKHNQLGLTPASQGHESSSDDENEEAKLASTIFNSANVLEFEYNGRTASLRTAADIAAWIAERKKNYPTQAKAEAAKKEAAEKKRKWAEMKKQREEAAQAKRLECEKVRQEELRLRALESKKRTDAEKKQKKADRARNDVDEEVNDHEIKAQKARIKAEKLRLKAEKAELKVLKAEARARKARDRRESSQCSASSQHQLEMKESPVTGADSAIATEDQENEILAQDKVGTESMNVAEAEGKDVKMPMVHESPTAEALILEGEDEGQASEISPDSSSSLLSISHSGDLSDADSTSSSGSSLSSSDSNSDPDSAPEQTTSKRLQPTSVPPPPRRLPTHNNHLCRSLLTTGRCPRGDKCKYSHDLPDTLPSLSQRKDKLKERRKTRLGKVGAAEGPTKRERRKGLWQVMVEKEQEEERKQLLRAIIFMGERGMLGEDEKRATEVDGAA